MDEQKRGGKGFLWVVGIIIVFFIFWTFQGKSGNSTVTTKIGVVSPLTGGKAQIGEGLREAIKLAQKDFGPTKKNYQFIFEDSGGEPAKGASAAEKLVSIDKVSALISITSQDGNIANRAAEKAHIPHFGIANDHNVSKGDYNFVHWTPIDSQSGLFVQELKKRGIHNVAVFVENNDASIATIASFKKYVENTDITIVWMENFNKGTSDFRTEIQKMKNAKPELIMLEAFSPMIEVIATQLKDLKITTPISSITYIGTAQNQKLFEGVWYVSGGQASEDFSNKFEAQAGYLPTIGSHYGYDVARIYLTIFENNSNISGDSIVKVIKNFDFSHFASVSGITGMDADGQIISAPAVVTVKDGKTVVIK